MTLGVSISMLPVRLLQCTLHEFALEDHLEALAGPKYGDMGSMSILYLISNELHYMLLGGIQGPGINYL